MIWHHPYWHPVAFSFGPLAVHWYGLMYLMAFLFVATKGYDLTKQHFVISRSDFDKLITWGIWGTVVGGRLGYVLFYGWSFWQIDPWFPLKIWQGGMSFHGGFLGVALALWIGSRRFAIPLFSLTDWATRIAPIGLGLGRLGNWINGELWGRPTHLLWGVIYSHIDNLPRFPSALFEALGEGLILGLVLWCYNLLKPSRGKITAMFLVGYGLIRILCEQFRDPDPQLGFIYAHWFTMGMLLSLPMVFLGIMIWCTHQPKDK